MKKLINHERQTDLTINHEYMLFSGPDFPNVAAFVRLIGPSFVRLCLLLKNVWALTKERVRQQVVMQQKWPKHTCSPKHQKNLQSPRVKSTAELQSHRTRTQSYCTRSVKELLKVDWFFQFVQVFCNIFFFSSRLHLFAIFKRCRKR